MRLVVVVRLDAEVAAWLRGKGTDTQAEINRILRERMASEVSARGQSLGVRGAAAGGGPGAGSA
jgi:hypothetical protein